MADEAASQCEIEDLDIESMKVSELKKKLKDIGLPITGNKSELVERLQGSILATKNYGASNPGDIQLSSSELDSSILNDCSKLDSSSTEPEDNIAKTCDDEVFVSSSEKLKEDPVALNAFIPLKKRVVAQSSADGSKKPKEKKIVLNRNHIPTPKFIPNKPVEPLKNKNVITGDKTDITKCKDSKEGIISASIKEESNKIYLNADKNISENEKIILRAKRFNITAAQSISKSGKITISAKKDQTSNVTSTSSSNPSSETEGITLTALQQRSLRFGVNVSKVMKQLDKQQAQELKRKFKFNSGNGVTSVEEQEKKKKRAERFGLL